MISIPWLSSMRRSTAPPVAIRERAAYGKHHGAVVVPEGETALLVLRIAPWAVQAEREKAKREAERHEAALAEGDGQ